MLIYCFIGLVAMCIYGKFESGAYVYTHYEVATTWKFCKGRG
jgi:hypothetical protein